jgi:hypothetical protein
LVSTGHVTNKAQQSRSLLIKPPTSNTSIQSHVDLFSIKDVVYTGTHCLPHACYNPAAQTITVSALQTDPGAVLFFKCRGEKADEFFIFAIGIGGHALNANYPPRITFIPMLRDGKEEEDLRQWSVLDEECVQWCMTELQLGERLDLGDYSVLGFDGPFAMPRRRIIRRWTDLLAWTDLNEDPLEPSVYYCDRYDQKATHELSLLEDYQLGMINLVETGVRVQVEVHEKKPKRWNPCSWKDGDKAIRTQERYP